jgi:hypothetical protein
MSASSIPAISGETKFVNAVPFYENKDGAWQSFNFFDRAIPEMLINIAPFSEAQKNIFVRFPEILAENFGVGREVSFCLDIRCIEIGEKGREEPVAKDRIFLKSLDTPPWASQYFVRAVEAGILEPGERGELDAGKIVTRGEFAEQIFKLQTGENLPPSPSFSKREGSLLPPLEKGELKGDFSDVPEASEFYKAVTSLAERGVVRGYEDGTFRPLNLLTRAEAVKIILAAQGFTPPPFIKGGNSPREIVPILSGLPQSGISWGEGGFSSTAEEEGNLLPPTPSFPKREGGDKPFPDTTGWEVPWVTEAVKRKFVSGYHDGLFRPHQTLTRAESLKLLFEGLK